MDDVIEKVKEIIHNQLGVEVSEIKMTTNFTKDLKADSLDVVELIMALEDEFDLLIEDDQAGKLLTVGDVIEYIRQHN